MQRVNKISVVSSAVITVPVAAVSLGSLFDYPVCQSIFLYSPLNDTLYPDNTLPMFLGGQEVLAGLTGQPLLPGQWMYFEIDSVDKIFVNEPTGAGTQLLIATISG